MDTKNAIPVHQLSLCLCSNWQYIWPCWKGGNKDFLVQGQPFDKVVELRRATLLEF